MRGAEDYGAFPFSAELSDLLQGNLIHDDLLVDSREDGLHCLSHVVEGFVAVVRNNRFDVDDGDLLDFSVDLIFRHISHQLAFVVSELFLDEIGHRILNCRIR